MATVEPDPAIVVEVADRLARRKAPSDVLRGLVERLGHDTRSAVVCLWYARAVTGPGIAELEEPSDWEGFGGGGTRTDAELDADVRRVLERSSGLA